MMKTLAQLFLLTLLLATASCKRSDVASNQNASGGNVASATGGTSSTPPFATKEPERYQAVRVITTSGGVEATTAAASSSQTFIARDGDRRREDYEAAAGEKISYLQLPGSVYELLPARKLYAELKPEGEAAATNGRAENVPPDFSPDKLLNEARPESVYERIGAETINGRATVKYRVTMRGQTGASREVMTESLVWVDESLGMPIKSETTSTGGAASGARITMELRDIKETVDAGLFELPPDYRKVTPGELFTQVNRADSSGKGQD
jgi:hypothetical protein